MRAEQLELEDLSAAVAVWANSGCDETATDLGAYFERILVGSASTAIGVRVRGDLVGVAIVGHDDHRGWIRNLVVVSAWERRGFGSELVARAEDWLTASGAREIHMTVPHSDETSGLFERLRYDSEEVTQFTRWLG